MRLTIDELVAVPASEALRQCRNDIEARGLKVVATESYCEACGNAIPDENEFYISNMRPSFDINSGNFYFCNADCFARV